MENREQAGGRTADQKDRPIKKPIAAQDGNLVIEDTAAVAPPVEAEPVADGFTREKPPEIVTPEAEAEANANAKAEAKAIATAKAAAGAKEKAEDEVDPGG